MDGRLTFLGTGTSMGVPTLGCECPVCTSADVHDKRLRPSVVVRWRDTNSQIAGSGGRSEGQEALRTAGLETGATVLGGGGVGLERVVVIDTGPDFREQAL